MSSDSNTETDNTRVEINVDSPIVSKDETVTAEVLDNGQPKAQLKKVELLLVMIGYVFD